MPIAEDRFDSLDDAALLQFLSDETDRRREHLVIEESNVAWIAETYESGGLSSGRSVMLGAAGPDRRTAMLDEPPDGSARDCNRETLLTVVEVVVIP